METAFPFILQNIHRYFLYLAIIPLFFLWLDAARRSFSSGGSGSASGVVILLVNAALLTGYSLSCHSLRHLVGGRMDCFSCTRRTQARHRLWQRLTRAQPPPHGVGLGEPDLGDPGRRLRPAPRAGRHHRPGDPPVSGCRDATRAHQHDVLVIGAGGAGLRAAIEAAGGGRSVGLVCKSLLGKAHTVMAEGGIAAALGTSTPTTTGRSTSATRWSAARC